MSIYKYGQSIAYYYDYAMACVEEEDYVTALDYLFRAIHLTKDTHMPHFLMFRMQIAECYCDMNLNRQSLKEYYRLLRRPTRMEDEVYIGIIKNLICLNMMPQAARFYNEGIELGHLDPYDGFSPLDLTDDCFDTGEIRLLKSTDAESIVSIAKQMAATGQDDYACQLLETVGSESTQYASARNTLAMLLLSKGDGEKSLALVAEAEQALEGESIETAITKISALDLLGRTDERDRQIESLENTDWVDDLNNFARLAACMAHVNNNKLTLKYCDRELRNKPFDRDMNLLCALASANLGYVDRAKEILVDLQIIFPEDFTLKYYARLIWQTEGKTRIPLKIDLPSDEQRYIFNEVFDWLTAQKDVNASEKELNENETLKEHVFYALNTFPIKQQCFLAAYLAALPSYQHTVRDCLVDPDYPIVAKKEILLSLLACSNEKRFELVINDAMFKYLPRQPKLECRNIFKKVYWQVYATLAFISSDFDKKLNASYKALVGAFKGRRTLSEQGLAAILAFRSRASSSFVKRDDVCEIFNCERSVFEEYLECVKQAEKEKEKKPSKKTAKNTAERNEGGLPF